MAFVLDDFLVWTGGMLLARVGHSVIKGIWNDVSGKEEKAEEIRIRNISDKLKADKELRRIDFEQKLQIAEKQFVDNINEWNRRKFYDNCWPLRNPFEMPMGFNLKYKDSSTSIVEACDFKLLTFTDIDGETKKIVPCRIISALKNNAHPYAESINANLSSFILNHYAANGLHATISEIGAWRDEIASNDASVNYLYTGLKGQPVMVLMPEFIDDGSTVVFKMFTWGLGEDLPYPCGFEFGRLNMRPLLLQCVYEASLHLYALGDKMGYDLKKVFSKELIHNFQIIHDIKKAQLKGRYENDMLQYLKYATELKPLVEKAIRIKVSGMFCAIAALYADTYHLLEYKTLPKLPSILKDIPGVEYMLPAIKEYYIQLLSKMELIESDHELLSELYINVANAFSKLPFSYDNQEKMVLPFVNKAMANYIMSKDQKYREPEYVQRLKDPVTIKTLVAMHYEGDNFVQETNKILKRVKLESYDE